MRIHLLILILIFPVVNLYSQNTLTGKIMDKDTKELLVGASIYFPDLKKGATTDKDGSYKIADLPEGRFLVEVRFIGYSVQVVKIEIYNETKMDFELEETHKELNEVVVTGSSSATEKAINPIPTITINKISLYQNSSTNIIDAISNKPGISQITTGAGISKPVIRGLGFNRVIVLQNNIRQEGQQWGEEHGIEMDEFSIDRVEIIKGPGSLIYGSDAMAGVINFLPPNPTESGKINLNILSSYHSNNNQLGYSLINAGNIKGIHWLVQGSAKNAGNYSNAYDGRVYNSGFNEMNLTTSAGIAKKWGYSHLNFSSFNQNLGLVEGERDSLGNFVKPVIVSDSLLQMQTVTDDDLSGFKIGIPRQMVKHLRISSTSKFILGKSRLGITFGFQQNKRREYEYGQEYLNNKLTVEEINSLSFLLNTLNFDLTFYFPELKGWESSIGVNGHQQTNFNQGVEFIIPEYGLFDAGIFVVTKKSFDRLYISGGMRYNYRTIHSKELLLNDLNIPTTSGDTSAILKFSSIATTFSALVGSLGASYKLGNNSILKTNISNGFRSPNISELASNGAHEGTFRYEIGDQNLKAEKSLQLDLGILMETKHVSFEFNVFNNNINDYIFSQRLIGNSGSDSLIVDDGDSLSVFKFIQKNARLLGGEISIDFHPHPFDWLHFENSFSIVDGKLMNASDSTKYLPFIPAPKFQSEVRAQFKKAGKAFANFYINIKIDYFFQQNRIYSAYNTETETPSYLLLNAGLGSDVMNKKGNTLFSFYFSATNILDNAYQSHLSRLKYAPENYSTSRIGVFNTGRNFSIKLVVPIALKK